MKPMLCSWIQTKYMDNIKLIEAGKIVNTHGVNGEVKIEVWLDSPAFFKKFKRVFINGEEHKVISSTIHKGFIIASVEGVSDINEAMKYKETVVLVNKNDVKLPKGSFYYCEIIGAKVIDISGREVGILEEVMENPAQPIYVVRGEAEHLIPAIPEFIMSTDLDEKIITVKLIEGM